MKVYFATDHSGLELKNELMVFVESLGHTVEDCGAFTFDSDDDYPDFVAVAAQHVSEEEGARAIVIGGSGQGEAMCANRFKGVRAAVFYGAPQGNQVDVSGKELSMIDSIRIHNNANVLSLGARFMSIEESKRAVEEWLTTVFLEEERHVRRITKLDY